MKAIALILTFGLLAACTPDAGPPSGSVSNPPPTTWAPRCPESIDLLKQPSPGLEVVLDAVALPTGQVLQANPTNEHGWLFAKHGLLVRSNRAVRIAVDPAATEWARIGWSSISNSTEFTLPTCSDDDPDWRVYAGGYSVRSGPRCLPLTVRVGDRTAQVRIGVGVAC
jgi:hypothetical protein